LEKNTITEIDETISVICKRIQDNACENEAYAETVKALAALVGARAILN
jgi:hypothetical protein